MKKYRIYFLCFVATILATNLSSCKSDNNDEPNTPSTKECQISKVLFEDGEYYDDFTFDSKGRITSYKSLESGHPYDDLKTIYEYTSTLITLSYDYTNRDHEYEYMRYYLENGLIVRMIDVLNSPEQEITLEYDSNKQLVKVNNYWGRHWDIEWDKGNISKISYINDNGSVSRISTYEYTSYNNTLSLFEPYTSFGEFDSVILAGGFFGKVSKNLLSKRTDTVLSDNSTYTHTFSYSGFNSDGYPTSMTYDEERIDLMWK